jgi:hypothetical protein
LTDDVLFGKIPRDSLFKRSFPAVYVPNNPSISSLLITPDDFKKFGYDFPDSLVWILPYLKKN